MRPFAILLGLTFFLALDFYVFQAVKLLFSPNSPWRRAVFSAYWGLAALAIGIYLFYHFGPRQLLPDRVRYIMLTVVFMHYFSKVFGIIPLLLDDLVRGVQWVLQKVRPQDVAEVITGKESEGITRSEFLAKTSLALVTVPFATMSFGILSGAHDYRVRRRQIHIAGLPKGLDGLRVAQLSDIHVGSFISKKAVRGGVEMLMQEKPDLFLFTGDLVNNKADEMRGWADVFSQIKAPLGQFSVMGNHDYGDYYRWENEAAKKQNHRDFLQLHKELGWDLMRDENRILNIQGEKLALIGPQNWGTGGFAQYGDLKKAYHGAEDADTRILLSHDPSHWDAQVRPDFPDIDLMLAGHTHGMQFGVDIPGFRWSPVQYRYKQWADLYEENGQFLYVNRGFGYIGYPGRIGILPEIAILELKRA